METSTRTALGSVDRRLVEGQRYRVRLDAKDSLGRQGRFRDTLER